MRIFSLALLIVCPLLFFQPCKSQTFAEWFKQNATQKKYLIQQILKLQIYLTYTKKGYNIADKGLGIIGGFKDEDFHIHELFFSDQLRVKPIINNHSKVKGVASDFSIIKNNVLKIRTLLTDSEAFLDGDAEYINRQLDNMLNVLQDDVHSLNDVVADNWFRMGDKDRVERIEKVYQSVSEKKHWVVQVYENCLLLVLQRKKGVEEIRKLKQLYLPNLK